jgi:hypothetical protein
MQTRRTKRRYRGAPAPPWTSFVRVGPSQQANHGNSIREMWQNSRYLVSVDRTPVEYPESDGTPATVLQTIHLQIESHDHRATHDWREFQRIKNEILGEEEEAVETVSCGVSSPRLFQCVPPVVCSWNHSAVWELAEDG